MTFSKNKESRLHRMNTLVTKYTGNDKTTIKDPGESNLTLMTLNQFICKYLDEEYDGDISDMKAKCPNWLSDVSEDTKYQIFLLVDESTTKRHTMDKKTKKMYRKCGVERRRRLADKYYYDVPDNRIHSYIVVEHRPGLTDDKTLAINIVCSSNYSDIKGVGSYILDAVISSAKKVGYKDIVLEVGSDEMEDPEESEDEESSDEESSEESSEESDEESDEEEEEDEDEEESDDEEELELICELLCNRLWKKSVRHVVDRASDGVKPYYSFSEDYLLGRVTGVVLDHEEDNKRITFYNDEEHGYGGYYYHKARQNSKKLIQYYESHGFREDPKVHKVWECFSHLPFPSMRLAL